MKPFNIEKVAGEIKLALAGRQIYFTTSWDDGVMDDVKLVELAYKYDIPIMLFICPRYPTRPTLSLPLIRRLAEYCEIGSHTLSHQPIDNCSAEVAIEEVTSGRKYLEDVLNKSIANFCLVGGRYNQKNLEAIKNYVDSIRTTGAFSFRRSENRHFIIPSLQLRFQRRTHLAKTIFEAFKNLKISGFGKVMLETSRGAWQKDFISLVPEITNQQDIYLHLWGHSWDVEENKGWLEIETTFMLLKAIDAKPIAYSQFIERRKQSGELKLVDTTLLGPAGFFDRRKNLN